MFRFLHLADVHLDTLFASRREEARTALRNGVRKSFQNAVDLAIYEKLDAVLIAGDLFDNDRLAYSTERFVVRQIERLAESGIPVVYCTGNHDPGGGHGRASRIVWPANVHLVDQKAPKVVDLATRDGSTKVKIVSAGHPVSEVTDNLAAGLPQADGTSVHVGLLHAHVTDASSESSHKRYAPCSTADLDSKGFDYWALGHIHLRQKLNSQTEAWYSGSPQGRSLRETGSRGGLVVSITEDKLVDVQYRELGPVTWKDIGVDVSASLTHVDRLARELELAAQHEMTQTSGDLIIRFILGGRSTLSSVLRSPDELDSLEESLRDVLGVLDVEVDTRALNGHLDTQRFHDEPNVLGSALRLLESLSDADGSEIAKLLGDESVIDWRSADHDNIAELVEGLDEDIVSRMIKPQ